MNFLPRVKQWSQALKSETLALYFAARHPKTPWFAKVFVSGIVAYALSPIDLIPDFIPILGQLDDFILIPLGIAFAIRIIPAPVLEACRQRAKDVLCGEKPTSWLAGFIIVLLWSLLAVLVILRAY